MRTLVSFLHLLHHYTPRSLLLKDLWLILILFSFGLTHPVGLAIPVFFSSLDQVYCARGTVPKLQIEATSKGDEGASWYKH